MAATVQSIFTGSGLGGLPESTGYSGDDTNRIDLFQVDYQTTPKNLHENETFARVLTQRILDSLTGVGSFYVGPDGLSLLHWNALDFRWDDYTLPVSTIMPNPENGAIPMVQRRTHHYKGEIERFAVGARFNVKEIAGISAADKGINILKLVTEQIMKCALETLAAMVMRTLTNVEDYMKKRGLEENEFKRWTIRDCVNARKVSYGAACRGDGGLRIALSKIEDRRQRFKLPVCSHAIMHRMTASMTNQDSREVMVGGDSAQAAFRANSALTTYAGYIVNVADTFHLAERPEPQNMLEHESFTGEFYPSWAPGEGAVHNPDGIQIYNEEADVFQKITVDTMWENLLFMPDVEFYNPNIALPTDAASSIREQSSGSGTTLLEDSMFDNTGASAAATGKKVSGKSTDTASSAASAAAAGKKLKLATGSPAEGSMSTAAKTQRDMQMQTRMAGNRVGSDGINYLLIRDNIRRDMASMILYARNPGSTLMSDIHSLSSGNTGDMHSYTTYEFNAGCFVHSPEKVQMVWDVGYINYNGGKNISFCGAEEWINWSRDPERELDRGDILVIPMRLRDKEYEYLSLNGEFDRYGYGTGSVRKRNGEDAKWMGFDYTARALGIDNMQDLFENERTQYTDTEPANRNLIRGTVLSGDGKTVWSSGTNTFDGGDYVGAAKVRRGETFDHSYTHGMFGGALSRSGAK